MSEHLPREQCKILVLGAGYAQLDLIALCRELGMTVHACSNRATDPGKDLADHFALIDIVDRDGVTKYVDKHGIHYVYSVGADLAMPVISEVSKWLGLPYLVDPEVAKRCVVKSSWRGYLGSDFEGNVPFRVVQSLEEALEYNRYPSVIKPVDSQGQRGVFAVKSEEELCKCFHNALKHSRSGSVIVEDLVAGPEVSVNTHFVEGEITFFALSDRISWSCFPGGIIKKHRFPSSVCDRGMADATYELVCRAARKIGIRSGPAYFQVKFSGRQPKLIEITPRLDGGHHWRYLKMVTGVDILRQAIEHLKGNPPAKSPDRSFSSVGAVDMEYLFEKPGEKMKRDRYDVAMADFHQWYYEDGQVVRPLNGYFEKVGYVILANKWPVR